MTVAGVGSVSFSTIAFDFLSLVNPPAIDRVSPLSGPVAGGTLVHITGARFGSNATVVFVERDVGLVPTGVVAECTWRGEALGLSLDTDLW